MAVQWKKVYVFVSSTFNDMHAERDYLVKQVFPRLQEWCEQRKLRLVDIDLRWGVTEADATQNKRVVQVCLERIDACRPFFLCFLGQRRGWVPSKEDISPETYAQYPALDGYAGDASVTEMEVLHAFVNPLHRANADGGHARAEHSFFYLRQPEYLASLPPDPPQLRAVYTNEGSADPGKDDAELRRWRNVEIPGTGRPVHCYEARWDAGASTPEIRLPLRCPSTAERGSPAWQAALARWSAQWARAGVRAEPSGEIEDPAEREKAERFNARLARGRLAQFTCDGRPLADVVLADLQRAIQYAYPASIPAIAPTPLQRELDQQEQMLAAAGEAFVEREGDLAALDGYLQGDSPHPFFLTAPGGLGKTSLLARWIDHARLDLRAGESVHYRFIGASDGSATVDTLLRSMLEEIREIARKLDGEIPSEPEKMRAALPALVAAAGKRGRLVLVLDGLNQLETGMADLSWLPLALPPGVRLVASFKRGEPQAEAYLGQLRAGGQAIVAEVRPFDSLEDRRRLVRAYLSQYLKELDERHLEALIHSEGAGNPLYLKVVLAELRVFGAFADLGAKIGEDFGATPVSAFAGMLRRLEGDPAYSPVPPELLVPCLFSWLAHARSGLSAEELADLLARETWVAKDLRARAPEAVHGLLRQVRPYLSRREGRAGFFFESLRQAVQERYAAPGQAGAHGAARPPQAWHASLAEYFEALPLRWGAEAMPNRRKLAELAYQLAHAGLAERLRGTLWDYGYLRARLESDGLEALIADYDLGGLPDAGLHPAVYGRLRLLQGSLRISTPAIVQDAGSLPAQLTGRLAGVQAPEAEGLLEAIRRETAGPWLRPLSASLDAPGGALLRTFPGKDQAVALTADGRIAVTACEGKLGVWDVATGRTLHGLKGHSGIARPAPSFYRTQQHVYTLARASAGKVDRSPEPPSEFVSAVVVTPDGRLAVSASLDYTLKVWDVAGGRELRTLTGHTQGVKAVAVTPDGRLAISGSSDKTARVWDLETGAELHSMAGIADVTAVALTADGRLAFCGYKNGLLELWDLSSGRRVSLDGHGWQQVIVAVRFAAGGRRAASAGGKEIRVWDVQAGLLSRPGQPVRPVLTLSVPPALGGVWAMDVTADGKLAVAVFGDAALRICDLTTGAQVGTMSGHTGRAGAVAATPGGRLAVSVSLTDGTRRVWDVPAAIAAGASGGGRQGRRGTAGITAEVTALALAGPLAASASADGPLDLWDVSAPSRPGAPGGGLLRTISLPKGTFTALAPTPDGRELVTGSSGGTLHVLDAATGRELRSWQADGQRVTALAITPDARLVISAARALQVWETATGREVGTLSGYQGGGAGVTVTPDGRWVVSTPDLGGTRPLSSGISLGLRVWDLESGAVLRTLSADPQPVGVFALAPGGRRVAWGASTKTAGVWDLATGEEVWRRKDFLHRVWALAVTPDGSAVVAASEDGSTIVYDAATGEPLSRSHAGDKLLALTPDGRLAVSAAYTGRLRVWEVPGGREVAAFPMECKVTAVRVTDDGRRAVVGDERGRVHLLQIEGITPGPILVTAWRESHQEVRQVPRGPDAPRWQVWKQKTVLEAVEVTLSALAFGCPACRTWSEVPEEALGTELPCPRCGAALRLNPLAIDADWRPVAAAWKGA